MSSSARAPVALGRHLWMRLALRRAAGTAVSPDGFSQGRAGKGRPTRCVSCPARPATASRQTAIAIRRLHAPLGAPAAAAAACRPRADSATAAAVLPASSPAAADCSPALQQPPSRWERAALQQGAQPLSAMPAAHHASPPLPVCPVCNLAVPSSCRRARRTLTCVPVRQAGRQAAPTASQPWLLRGTISFRRQPQQPQQLGGCQAPASGLHPPAERQTRTASGSGWPAMRQQGPVAAAATLWMLSQTRPCT